MALTVNDENILEAAKYLDDVINGSGGSVGGTDGYDKSLKATYNLSGVIEPDKHLGYAHGSDSSAAMKYSFPGTVNPTYPWLDEHGTAQKEDPGTASDHGNPNAQPNYLKEPQTFDWSDSDAPWSEDLKTNLEAIIDNRRADILLVTQELESYVAILIKAMEEYSDVDVDNSGLIAESSESLPQEEDGRNGAKPNLFVELHREFS